MAGENNGMAKSSMAPGEHNPRLLRRGLLLEFTTFAWNVVGTIIVVVAAIEARSVALAGFGLDSLIEIFASTIVVWQIRALI
jgi:divalent metal cation (Fe/Co/Zn/Cd) transporter